MSLVLLGISVFVIIGTITIILLYSSKHDDVGYIKGITRINKDNLPICFYVNEEITKTCPYFERELQIAIEQWQIQTGKKYFCHLGEVSTGLDVPIVPYPDNEQDDVRYLRTKLRHEDGVVKSAVIYVEPVAVALSKTLSRDLFHELGHCLGLDHDRTPDSVMSEHPLDSIPRLTQADINLVNAVYGG